MRPLPRSASRVRLLSFLLCVGAAATASQGLVGTSWFVGGQTFGGEPSTYTLGTLDDNSVLITAFNSGGLLLRKTPSPVLTSVIVQGGYSSNFISATNIAGTIAGGGYTDISGTYRNAVYAHGGTIGGGALNTIGSSELTEEDAKFSTIAGGIGNVAMGYYSTVSGGTTNTATGAYAVVPGGYSNSAGSTGSFAGGLFATVRSPAEAGTSVGDAGTFVWCDGETDFVSTGPRQFLVHAIGGMGLNTNAPEAMLDIRADSTTFRPHIQLVEPANDYARITMRSEGVTRYWTIAAKNQVGGSAMDRINFYNSTGGNVMVIRGNRRVGIATDDPGVFTLAVNGECAKPGGGSWAVFSDPRLKTDMKPLTGTLDTLLTLRGYEFEYTPDAVEKNLALPGKQIGLNAEEVERVFPSWVGCNDDGYRYVTERGTTALMVEALRDLRTEKDTQVQKLERENADLRARLEAIEAMLKKQ